MKLQRESLLGLNLITAYDAEHVAVNRQRYEAGLVVSPDTVLENWLAEGIAALKDADIAKVCELKPALVLLGTGQRQVFPPVALLRPLIDAGIGFEIMDTGSACRTYNILASEGRNVAAALILDRSPA